MQKTILIFSFYAYVSLMPGFILCVGFSYIEEKIRTQGYSLPYSNLKECLVMSNEKQFPMTLAGKAKLEEELNMLKTVKRPEVVERIKVARSFGDLSENSEYDSAKEEQGFVEGRISTIESMLRNAVIITEDETNSTVTLGKTVTFVEIINGEKEDFQESYTIVGSAEADPIEGKISNDSPIAKALLGCKVEDRVKLLTPGGEMEVEILEIK